MDISLFDFHLPDKNIALRPAVPRDRARQLIVEAPGHRQGAFIDSYVTDFPSFLRAGDVLVFNDTKVIPSRLFGAIGAAHVEMTLHKRTGLQSWVCFMKNARRADAGKIIIINNELSALVDRKLEDGQVYVSFNLPPGQSMEAALHAAGQMPLPPYIASKRNIDDKDMSDYQTVYANREGAVAAPTAGLHFTPALLNRIKNMGVRVVYVTLHVGAGTFLPVKVADTDDHKMHAEWGEITPENAKILNDARENGGRIVAVGTTSLRLIESATDKTGKTHPFCDETAIFITPGYQFQGVDMLMTNFHLPKSTLFMLVCAFAGFDRMHAAYKHAINNGYRFYSYGDSSLLYRNDLNGGKKR